MPKRALSLQKRLYMQSPAVESIPCVGPIII
jgi:hypothetical protein